MAVQGVGGYGGNPYWPPTKPSYQPYSPPSLPVASPAQPDPAPPPAPADSVNFIELARLMVPWLPDALIEVWAEAYAEWDDGTLAMAVVRQDSRYDQYFPGNKRPDGSVRNPEEDYVSIFDGYNRVILESGLNPDLFASRLVALYEGDTSVIELQQRVNTVRTRIFDNIAEVRAVFGEFYNVADMGDEAFVAAALDPDVGDAILNRRIDVATVAASGRHAGFTIGVDFATRLVNAGLNQRTSTQNLFDPARALLPALNRSARRFGVDRTFEFSEFAEAAAFADPTQSQRIRRLGQQERGLFGQTSVRRQDDRLTGLVQR